MNKIIRFTCQKHFRECVNSCPDCTREVAMAAAPRRKSLDDCTPGEWDAASAAVRDGHKGVALATDQPAPVANALPAAWDLVMADMRERDRFGKDKYGVRLQPNNGRDFLADAYQEALDLAVYLRGAIYERDAK